MSSEIRKIRNITGSRPKVVSGAPAVGELRDNVPEYRFISGKGMFLFIKHKGVVYNIKLSTGGV